MRVQTFLAKLSMESLQQLDEKVNNWLERTQAHPRIINQVFGYERHGHHDNEEPVMITTIWYEPREGGPKAPPPPKEVS